MNEFWSKLNNPYEISSAILFIIGLISFTLILRQIFRSPTSYRIKLIAFYIFLILIQMSFAYYGFFKVTKLKQRDYHYSIANTSTFIFVLFEYVILAHLIKSNIRSKVV